MTYGGSIYGAVTYGGGVGAAPSPPTPSTPGLIMRIIGDRVIYLQKNKVTILQPRRGR